MCIIHLLSLDAISENRILIYGPIIPTIAFDELAANPAPRFSVFLDRRPSTNFPQTVISMANSYTYQVVMELLRPCSEKNRVWVCGTPARRKRAVGKLVDWSVLRRSLDETVQPSDTPPFPSYH